jgi:catechol 2,3-dioxygenase-like lactoylglutathione lyase family enzyme
MAVVGLHHVQVNVPLDKEADAHRFYGEIIGLERMERPQSLSDAGRRGVWFRCGEQEFHVFSNPEQQFDPRTSSQHPALLVDDLDALRERLVADGYEIEEAIPIAGRRRFLTRDPGGNRIEFLSLVVED